jgi:hypothetical protein
MTMISYCHCCHIPYTCERLTNSKGTHKSQSEHLHTKVAYMVIGQCTPQARVDTVQCFIRETSSCVFVRRISIVRGQSDCPQNKGPHLCCCNPFHFEPLALSLTLLHNAAAFEPALEATGMCLPSNQQRSCFEDCTGS